MRVQEKLCVEPYDNPQDALQYGVSYEECMKRQKPMGVGAAECSKQTIKNEPVFAVDEVSIRECFRCGAGNFTIEHKKKCPAANHKCEPCNITGHLERCCNHIYPMRKKQMMERLQNRLKGPSKTNFISEDSGELDDDEIV